MTKCRLTIWQKKWISCSLYTTCIIIIWAWLSSFLCVGYVNFLLMCFTSSFLPAIHLQWCLKLCWCVNTLLSLCIVKASRTTSYTHNTDPCFIHVHVLARFTSFSQATTFKHLTDILNHATHWLQTKHERLVGRLNCHPCRRPHRCRLHHRCSPRRWQK